MNYASHEQAMATLREMIRDIDVAMLTTMTHDGSLRSRPMATRQGEFDGVLWFLTSEGTAKAGEVAEHHAVNISYSKPEAKRYVSVSGKATLVRDREKTGELWAPPFKAWFPHGPNDPDLVLLRVEVQQAEYWDSAAGRMVPLAGFVGHEAAGRRFGSGEHRAMTLDPSGN